MKRNVFGSMIATVKRRVRRGFPSLVRRRVAMSGLCLAGLGVLQGPLVLAQEATDAASTNATARLTLERLFSNGEFDGEGVGALKWLKHGAAYVTFEDAADKPGGRDLVRCEPATGRRQVLAPSHWFVPPGRGGALSVEDFQLCENEARLLIFTNGRRVWRVNSRGDYWVLDLSSRELRQLGGDAPPSTLMFAQFSPDGERVCYVRDANLYVQDLRDWRITALTTNGSATLINGTFDWVYEEELSLRRGFRWSPDSQHIAYWQLDTTGVREFQLINNTDGLYSRVISFAYPKAGEQNAAARVGVVSADGGETRWLEVPGDPRNHYPARLDWVGNRLALQQFNRLQNTNRVMIANPDSGRVRTVLTETDRAWVENENEFRWVNGGRAFVWLSERDGWRHAYLAARSGRTFSPITQGEFDVIQIEAVDEAQGWLYYLASPDNATQQYLYRTRLEGGVAERLTPSDQPGSHSYNLSPDARWAIHTYSTATTPPVTALIRLPEHSVVKVLQDNQKLREKLGTLRPVAHEFFRVPVGEGVELDGWCLRPPELEEGRKYPVLFHVYGEPAGATVVDRWRGKGGLWHRMLVEQGYLVMSVDNRGTFAPRGRAWRKSIYRQVGLLASADQAAAVRAVAERWSYVDTNRVAIWGWSGGGSMSLNAIFRYPDVYQAAMAVAPVPNQRHYDTIYQERYMGLPTDNPDGYREGSPLNFAHQLRGHLLLMHGTGDDNCHYQGVEALINELVRHNKPFSLMVYPNRSHGIYEGENTTRHVYETLTRFLTNAIPPGPAGSALKN
ncbi:MAG: S9 family peptidase [Verrucomicrobiales bacterium]|nr:S9 family peptidase [Verrucomicrobiales bacterium]